ncbi:NYN domain-containing protein [Peptococcus simiae]|uniref:NYN domain-containing protein n=1 Tax=Peptococcus simiae TaxID=1643805 RepID=A0ABW9GYP4_9FIRM
MTTWLIVDGYNMIGQWPALSGDGSRSLEEARDDLNARLDEYGALSGWRVLVVYDGYRVKGNAGTTRRFPYLEIIYTPEGVTADMAIERLAAQLPKRSHFYVASGDRLIQETVLSLGGLRMTGTELRQAIADARVKAHRLIHKEVPRSTLDGRIDPEVRSQLEKLIKEDDRPS